MVLVRSVAGAGGRPPLAPQPGLRDLDALIERVRGTGLAVSVERRGRPFDVSGAAGLTVYRIVQEALTNALKHAHEPALVDVVLEFDDPDLSVRVSDDGRSVVPAHRWCRECQRELERSRRGRHGRARGGLRRSARGRAQGRRRLGGPRHAA